MYEFGTDCHSIWKKKTKYNIVSGKQKNNTVSGKKMLAKLYLEKKTLYLKKN